MDKFLATPIEERKRALVASVLFNGLSESFIDQIAGIIREKKFQRGEIIFLDGTISSGFYMVVQGQVKLFKMALDGREQILYVLGPGEPFGMTPVFHGQTFPASAASMTDSTAFFFPKKDFVALIAAHPDLAFSVMTALARRLRRFAAKIESLSLKEVPMRLAVHLLYLQEKQGGTDQVLLDIPKKQLANLLGTSAETLSRIFAEMSAAGLIQVKGKTITLFDCEALRKKSSGAH
jgi:CRP-like cAMP-binding protein